MANEYLKRTPTSTGDRSVWTWSGWVKVSDLSSAIGLFGSYHGGSSRYALLRIETTGVFYFFTGDFTTGSTATTNTWVNTVSKFRDFSGWMHITAVYNTTLAVAEDRFKLYVNGVNQELSITGSPSQNSFTYINSLYQQTLGAWAEGSNGGNQDFEGQMFDVFLVDGQALIPDVFGFYKDGDGYQSSGTTKATDFKPGQWSPRAPKSIKYTINRSGGFGVNGFYLPMNDSSNPGADFHCAPNSIIKLKGEDLPQPQNGAPITSDAFVSQLRQETGTLGFDGCVKIDADGDYLTVPSSSDFAYGTGDFTWEAFVFTSALSNDSASANYLFDHDQDGGVIQFYDGLIRYYNTTLGVTGNLYTKGGGLQSSTWHHVAVARQSGTTRLFVDGELRTSEADGHDYPAQAVTIGDFGGHSGANEWDGFISNARIIKGTALYTANFTAPTEPLTNVTNTKLLCCNSSTSATAATVTPGTITANGDVFATRNELTGSTVFAIPGISTSTSQDFFTNGNFETGIGGWSSGNGSTLDYEAIGGPSGNGCIKVTSPANSSNGYTFRALDSNLEVGKRYTLSFYYQHVSGGEGYVNIGNSTGASQIVYRKLDNSNTNWNQIHISFVAEVVGTFIGFYSKASSGVVRFANISLVQEDAARDYSADIIGSGTNKTVNTVAYPDSNNSDHRVPAIVSGHSPYGSYINYDSPENTGGWVEVSDATAFDNVNLTTAEWTYEAWYKRGIVGSGASNLVQFGNAIDYQAFGVSIHPSGRLYYVWSYDGSNWDVLSSSDGPVIPQDEWCHIAIVKEATPTPRIVTYVNGVFAKSVNVTSNISYTSPDYMRIGGHYRGTGGGGDTYFYNGGFFDARFYNIVKYKGGFDVSKPYTPVGIEAFRTTADTCKNNFATWNPLTGAGNAVDDNAAVLKGGNLYSDTSNQSQVTSTIGMNSGKWYAEYRLIGSSVSGYLGVTGDGRAPKNNQSTFNAFGQSLIRPGAAVDNSFTKNWTATTLTAMNPALGYSSGDVFGFALDLDSSPKTLKFYRNNTLIHTDSTIGDSGHYYFMAFRTNDGSNGVNWADVVANFGQNPTFSGTITAGTNADDSGKGLFKYAPPTGFLALCTDNLPAPAIADPGKYFKSVLYTGSGVARHPVTGVGFKPDFVWLKGRTGSSLNHILGDIVRGPVRTLFTNNALQEYTDRGVSSFDEDGFSLSSPGGDENAPGTPYVAWCWKAGGPAVSNTEGNITTQVSANPEAGFSIVKSNGPGTSGHGLNSTPKFIIQKSLTAGNWNVAHHKLYEPGGTGKILLNLTGNVAVSSTTYMHGATATTFDPLFSTEQIAYVWAEIEGFSKFGSYVGNSSFDGPFVYCGFKPAWVLVKNIDTSNSHWVLWDSSRTPNNEMQNALRPNSIDPETAGFQFDFLSNGFKVRDNELSVSEEGDTFIFAAFAESPFQTANAK